MRLLITDAANPGTSRLTPAAWTLLLVLSPLAYIGSAYLETRVSKSTRPFTINRDGAIHLATQFAETRNLQVKGWVTAVSGSRQSDVTDLLKRTPQPEIERLAPPVTAQVIFKDLSGPRSLHVNLAPDGQLAGFEDNASANSSIGVEESVDRQVAEKDLTEWLGRPPAIPLEFAESQSRDNGKKRTFTWKTTLPRSDAVLFHVDVAGGMAVGRRYDVSSRYVDPWRALRIGLGVIATLYLVVSAIYAVVRFLRRKADREISMRRTLAVMAAFVAFSMFFIASGAVETNVRVSASNGSTLPAGFFWTIFLTMSGVIGIFFGIAYGAGEGDVRAAYPGKLTSLDTLLSGRLFSRNVALSILAGGGFAGWLLLVKNGSLALSGSAHEGYQTLNSLLIAYPLLGLISDKLLDSVTISTFALLLPISMLRPRVRRDRLFYALLPLFSALGCGIWMVDNGATADRAISIAVGVAAICLPFFFHDFLATISCILALQFVTELSRRSAMSMEWRQYAISVLASGALFLLVELYFALRGRTFSDAEVRPAYAKFLAEHLALQAEIGAARQAQLRLLPDQAPRIPGLSIAGSCVPARELGGDFFDYYPLDDLRLGVFLAEGGNRELGAAMTVAFAKGFLLYTSGLELAPPELLRRLQETLALVEQRAGASISMLYAVIDPRAGSIRFARSGETAQFLINGRDAAAEVATDREGPNAILHGAARLEPGDALFFYTDGLAAQIQTETRGTPGQFFAKISRDIPGGSAIELHSAVMGAANRRRQGHPPDDLTAVVVRLAALSEYAIEGVA